VAQIIIIIVVGKENVVPNPEFVWISTTLKILMMSALSKMDVNPNMVNVSSVVTVQRRNVVPKMENVLI